MPRKRILIVTKLYHPWIGGVERHVQDAAEALKDRFDIRILCCQEPKTRDERREIRDAHNTDSSTHPSSLIPHPSIINGIPVYKCPSLGIYLSMPAAPAFPFWLKRLAAEADIIHYHLPFPLAILSHWLLSVSSTLTPSHAHTLTPFILTWHSDIVRQKFLASLLSPWTRWFLNKTNAIVATSQRLIESSGSLGPFQNKCRVISLSVNPKTFELTPAREQAAQAVRKKYAPATLALFVGRLVPYKGPRYLLEAAAQAAPGLKILIVGSGPLEKEMRRLSLHLGLNSHVEFLGSMEGEELVRLYHACDFLVLPSITPNEAFGIVQLEAMACGKPVINTNLSTGVPGVSLHEQTGLTVPPQNAKALAAAMDKLAQNVSLRLQMGAQAKKRAFNEFSLEKMASRLEALYAGLSP